MESIVVLDFGSQYCHLISRRIKDIGIRSLVMPSETSVQALKNIPNIKGIILSGGAASVYDAASPDYDPEILSIGLPILGICYGHQLIAHLSGADIKKGERGEYGIANLSIKKSKLFDNLNVSEEVWMNHGDSVLNLPTNFKIIGATDNCAVAAYENTKDDLYGIQFHPEVSHTKNGTKILENFILDICNAKISDEIKNVKDEIIAEARKEIGDKKAIIGLSGGIDSSVAAILMKEAIGKNLTAVYVDTGLMRQGETQFIRDTFRKYNLNLRVVNAKKSFFEGLKGVTSPERKRKIIGRLFVEHFDKVAKEIKADFLIQGTIYSDRIESGSSKHSSKIKSHHNVGGLPKRMKLTVYEPLRELYKDEVRELGAQVNLPESLTKMHVFPGPGLGIRILGEVTPKKATIVRKATHIIEDEMRKADLHDKVWMAFAILLPVKSVGIQGDARSYKYPIVLRIIESKDAMTASFARIPYEILEKISTRITNEIDEVNRVVYDISNKPPATMEWE